jgi:hypothetical protein
VLDEGREGDNRWNMPRAMRVEYPGAIYHVIDRWDRQEDVFGDEVDRQDLLKTLAAPEHRPGCMRVDRLPGERGIQGDSAAGRQEFRPL